MPPPSPQKFQPECYGITQDDFCNPVFWCLAGLSVVALIHDLGRRRSWQDRGVYGFFTVALALAMIARALLHQITYWWVYTVWELGSSTLRNGGAVFLAAPNVGWGGVRVALLVGVLFSAGRIMVGAVLGANRWRSRAPLTSAGA